MPVLPVVKTTAQVLQDLNGGPDGPWVVIKGNFGIAEVEINGKSSVNYLAGESGIVLRAFLNTATAEVKLFVAKYLDIPNRELLFVD